ncbi:MAG TPA: ABC transporter C-terminal domain-containing protein, partial [Polyangiales bacterium]
GRRRESERAGTTAKPQLPLTAAVRQQPPTAAGATAPTTQAKPAAAPSKPSANRAPVSKNRIQKLEREVKELETKITALESAQKARSDLLADPGVYADKQRSTQLLAEFRDNQPELERLTARWEQAVSELESLTAADGGESK